MERSLVPRERRFYELFKQQAATLVRAGGLLERALADSTNLSMLQREIKDLENQGDELTHEIVSTLQRTFVTPFDHEDIYALAALLVKAGPLAIVLAVLVPCAAALTLFVRRTRRKQPMGGFASGR